jgi:hypothetical protein
MKNLLIVLAITFVVFACHTKKPQDESGINDPVNIAYNDVDSSVLSFPTKKEPAVISAPEETVAPCIDSAKIDSQAVCTQDIAPVCGCDGKEYTNQCQAEKGGVTTWTEGPCAVKSDKKEEEKK